MRTARIVLLLAAAVAAVADTAWADCTETVRPATAEEKRIYADAYAMFKRMAPAAPSGWTADDTAKDGVLTEVCAAPGERIAHWTFWRQFKNSGTAQDRQQAAQQQFDAVAQRSEARQKANEAKLADVQRQIEALAKKAGDLATAGKLAELPAVTEQIDKLTEQQKKLMGVEESDAAMADIGAKSRRDSSAYFSLSVAETDLSTSGYAPFAAPVGKGYRQDYDNHGNPESTIVVVLNPAAPARAGSTVVRVGGDSARVEALLKAATLR